MLRITHSIPDKCLDCGSENLGGRTVLEYEEGNTVFCNNCGIFMIVQEEDKSWDEHEISASFLSCPHCCTVDEIQVYESEERCNNCGLDPNRLDYKPEELAFLWKEGSGIRGALERGVPKNTNRLYRFLTSLCGPHCSFAESCPQNTGNFVRCYREEVIESDDPHLLQPEEDKVGKGRRKRNRKAKRERRKERERIQKEKERAVLVYAKSGWYSRMYNNETEDSQKPEHTGGGSGT